MNAIEILEKDHKNAKNAMQAIAMSSGAKRQGLLLALKRALESHDRIEEGVFYPGVSAHAKGANFSAGDKAAHASVETVLATLEGMSADDPQWVPTFSGMRSQLAAHIADEEGKVFPKIRKALSSMELYALGVEMNTELKRQAEKV
jgi:hypothetical protein